MGPLMSVAANAVGPNRAGAASSLINVARIAGATLGAAVLGVAFKLFGGGEGGGRHAAGRSGATGRRADGLGDDPVVPCHRGFGWLPER